MGEKERKEWWENCPVTKSVAYLKGVGADFLLKLHTYEKLSGIISS